MILTSNSETDGIFNIVYEYDTYPALVNGKRFWIHENKNIAIWFNGKFSNWLIGPLRNIGSDIYHFKSNHSVNDIDVPPPQDITMWVYSNLTNALDVNIQDFDILPKAKASGKRLVKSDTQHTQAKY